MSDKMDEALSAHIAENAGVRPESFVAGWRAAMAQVFMDVGDPDNAVQREREMSSAPEWWHYRINGRWDGFSREAPPDDAYDTGTLTPLYSQLSDAVQREMETQTKSDVEAAFRDELMALLEKYDAELEASDHWQGYPECGEDVRMIVTVPAIYDENNETRREWTEIDLGSWLRGKRP